jgi:hypothetical protein
LLPIEKDYLWSSARISRVDKIKNETIRTENRNKDIFEETDD